MMAKSKKRAKSQLKRIVIIAGPNGAGKTTFAQEFLLREADCAEFINADLIALGISPYRPEKAAIRAGKVMLTLMAEYVRRGESFAFETTLSGRAYTQHISRWRKAGYLVKFIFLALPSAEFALARVADRVAKGGHNVQPDVVRRRFDAGLKNFQGLYRSLVDDWILYDNSGHIPVPLATGGRP